MPSSGALKSNHVLRSSGEAGRDTGRAWRRPAPSADLVAWVAISILLLVAAVLFVRETRGTTLSFDEWVWALDRRGGSLDTFLAPHNGHLSLIPVTIYKLLFATAGLRHYAPYRAVVIVAHLGVVLLVFVYAKRRVSSLIAVAAAALILFLGPGWQNFLWPFQVAWLISIGAGLGALLLLDRRDRLGDRGACALLACSLASSGIGLAVAVGLAVDVLARGDRRQRAWIVVGPLAVYALWWIGYQNTSLTRQAVELAPGFVATTASSTFAALAGLSGPTVPFGSGTLLTFGPPLALAAVLGLAWRLRRPGSFAPRLLALLALPLSFWLLAALGRSGVAAGYSSRYLYVGGVFMVILGSELLAGVSVSRTATLIGAALLVAVLVSNIGFFTQVGSYERTESQLTEADLGALDIGRPVIAPGYRAADFPGFGVAMDAKSYFATERAIGTPAASPSQIQAFPDGVRREADAELIAIHRVAPSAGAASAGSGAAAPGIAPAPESVAGGSISASSSCLAFTPAPFAGTAANPELALALPTAGLRISAQGGPVTISVRRFSTQFQPVGSIAAGGSAQLRIGADLASAPWHVQIAPAARVKVCGLG